MMRAIVLALTLALAGCAGAPLTMPFAHDAVPSQPPPKPVIKTVVKQVCLPSQGAWSDADLLGLHDALVPIPDGSLIIRAVREWFAYRKDNTACINSQK